MGELFERGSLFNLAKMIISVLQNYKELECKVQKVHMITIITVIPGSWRSYGNHSSAIIVSSGCSDRKKNQRRGICDSLLLVVCGGP